MSAPDLLAPCPGSQLWLWSRPVGSAPKCPRCTSRDGHHSLACWAEFFRALNAAGADQ
jgi:hypothetical protein